MISSFTGLPTTPAPRHPSSRPNPNVPNLIGSAPYNPPAPQPKSKEPRPLGPGLPRPAQRSKSPSGDPLSHHPAPCSWSPWPPSFNSEGLPVLPSRTPAHGIPSWVHLRPTLRTPILQALDPIVPPSEVHSCRPHHRAWSFELCIHGAFKTQALHPAPQPQTHRFHAQNYFQFMQQAS